MGRVCIYRDVVIARFEEAAYNLACLIGAVGFNLKHLLSKEDLVI